MACAVGVDRTHLLARLGDPVLPDHRASLDAMVARRLSREPLAYIVGEREFYDVLIECAPGALIPRPETEMLVAFAVEQARRVGAGARVADVGTGSGAIAVAVALNAPQATITAIDTSVAALDIAERNVVRHGLESQVTVTQGDMLAGRGEFDVVVANLPYVAERDWRDLAPEIRDYEPRAALVAGPTGSELIEILLRAAPAHLAGHGSMALEIGVGQAAALLEAARRGFPEANVCVMKDFGGIERVLTVAPRELHGPG